MLRKCNHLDKLVSKYKLERLQLLVNATALLFKQIYSVYSPLLCKHRIRQTASVYLILSTVSLNSIHIEMQRLDCCVKRLY